MTVHAAKLRNALELLMQIQRNLMRGTFGRRSGVLLRFLRYLGRIVRTSPPDSQVCCPRALRKWGYRQRMCMPRCWGALVCVLVLRVHVLQRGLKASARAKGGAGAAAQVAAGRHQLPYEAAELWPRLMWQSIVPCLSGMYSYLMHPWQLLADDNEVLLVSALPWSTVAAAQVGCLQSTFALSCPVHLPGICVPLCLQGSSPPQGLCRAATRRPALGGRALAAGNRSWLRAAGGQ
jgi:hypothetical protein